MRTFFHRALCLVLTAALISDPAMAQRAPAASAPAASTILFNGMALMPRDRQTPHAFTARLTALQDRWASHALPTGARHGRIRWPVAMGLAIIIAGSLGLFVFVARHTPTAQRTPAPAHAVSHAAEKSAAVAKLTALGFTAIGNDYYVKSPRWLLRLKDDGTVADLFVNTDLSHRDYLDAVTIDFAPTPEPTYRFITADRTVLFINRTGSSGSEDGKYRGPFFTPEEAASPAPYVARLRKLGAKEVSPGLFQLGDDEPMMFWIQNGKPVLIMEPKNFHGLAPASRVLDERTIKNEFEEEKQVLHLENGDEAYDIEPGLGSRVPTTVTVKRELPAPLTPEQDYHATDGDFKIGGVNSDAVIEGMHELAGRSIATIQSMARPAGYVHDEHTTGISNAGFLGEHESFLQRLKTDNAITREGFTHQQLAAPLFYIMNVLTRTGTTDLHITYRGERYHVTRTVYRGFQTSLFGDGLLGDTDYEVTNERTGERLPFAQLVPYYIHRYGFYEGDTSYRVDPRAIIRVFGLKPQSPPRARTEPAVPPAILAAV